MSGKTTRLSRKSGSSKLRKRMKVWTKGTLGFSLYWLGLYTGTSLVFGAFQKYTPAEAKAYRSALSDANSIGEILVKQGWKHSTVHHVKGEKFTKDGMEVKVTPFNLHIRFIDQILYDKSFKSPTKTLTEFNRIMGDDEEISALMRRGSKWVLPNGS